MIYVLSFDDKVVAQILASSYGSDPKLGYQFLEKIVQFPFPIPAIGQGRLVDYVFKHARNAAAKAEVTIDDDQWTVFRDAIRTIFSHRLTTPRQAIRYGNALDFALPILKGEVFPLQQMLVEGVRVLFPELYVYLRDRQEIFDNSTEETFDQHARRAMPNLTHREEIEAVTRLLMSLRSDHPQSISNHRYFDRYFTYTLPSGEIGDAEFSSLLTANDSPASLLGLVEKLAERNPAVLLQRLTDARDEIRGTRAAALARVLAACGCLFSEAKSKRTLDNLVALLLYLLRVGAPGSRFDLWGEKERYEVESIELKLVPVLMTALVRENSAHDDVAEKHSYFRPPIITDENWPIFRETVSTRIRAVAMTDPNALFVETFGAADLFDIWRDCDQGDLNKWLDQHLAQNPEYAIGIIRYMFPSKCSIDQASYHIITEKIPAHLLTNAFTRYLDTYISANANDVSLLSSFLKEGAKMTSDAPTPG